MLGALPASPGSPHLPLLQSLPGGSPGPPMAAGSLACWWQEREGADRVGLEGRAGLSPLWAAGASATLSLTRVRVGCEKRH